MWLVAKYRWTVGSEARRVDLPTGRAAQRRRGRSVTQDDRQAFVRRHPHGQVPGRTGPGSARRDRIRRRARRQVESRHFRPDPGPGCRRRIRSWEKGSMSGDDLRVTSAHLVELAVKQARGASETRSATFAVEGVAAAVRSTHGIIASATAGAVEDVVAARRDAGTRMAAISDDMCGKSPKQPGATTRSMTRWAACSTDRCGRDDHRRSAVRVATPRISMTSSRWRSPSTGCSSSPTAWDSRSFRRRWASG